MIGKLSEPEDSATLLDNSWRDHSRMVHRTAQPAGGLYSTAEDVGDSFARCWLNGGTWHGRGSYPKKRSNAGDQPDGEFR